MSIKSIWKVFLLNALFSVGCTDVNPTVGMLKSIEGFQFEKSQITTANLSYVPLKATCSSFLQTIEMSFDGSTWIQPTAYDPNAKSNCDSGTFSIILTNTRTPWKTSAFSNNANITVKFRALPRVGPYIYRDVVIKYTPSPPFSQEVLAGSQIQSGGGFHLRGKLRAQGQGIAQQGGGFKIRGRILQ
ncbi:MAG: hypothetical protein ACXWRG_11070 [Bdellovibrio sp.]